MGLRIHGEFVHNEAPQGIHHDQKTVTTNSNKSAVQNTIEILYEGPEHAETVCVLLQEDLPPMSKEKYDKIKDENSDFLIVGVRQ